MDKNNSGNWVRGMGAGVIATIVLSVMMMAKAKMGLMPQLDIIAMLSGMLGISHAVAWGVHFAIGAVWGVLFAFAFAAIPMRNAAVKGMEFSAAAWLLMMVVLMPMAGAGLFGRSLGIIAPMMTLMLHLIFGVVMGWSYSMFTSHRVAAAL